MSFSYLTDKLSADLIILIQASSGLNRLHVILCVLAGLKKQSSPFCDRPSLSIRGNIELSQVSYMSPSGEFLLHDISMQISPGQFVAIIGSSGAGKSTILRLLLGLETPTSGCMTIDSIHSHSLDMKEVRSQFGVVLQNAALFPGTIFSNMAVHANISLEEAWQLASIVGLEEDINRMPMKMYTHISDIAGDSISGGQKQKILIARALASKPAILFLDEATSALDNESQSLIFKHLKTLNTALCVIAHRHSTIVGADVIYVIEKGKVFDKGTYPELLAKGHILAS